MLIDNTDYVLRPLAFLNLILSAHDETERTLERLDSQTSILSQQQRQQIPTTFDFGDRTTYPVPPNKNLLSRVQDFLPQIQAANDALTNADPGDIDIENLDGQEERYIEMNLGLGVFTDRSQVNDEDEDEENDGDDPMMSEGTSSDSDNSDGSSDNDSSSSNESHEIITGFSLEQKNCALPRPTRPLPRRVSGKQQPPKIEIVEPVQDSGMDCKI